MRDRPLPRYWVLNRSRRIGNWLLPHGIGCFPANANAKSDPLLVRPASSTLSEWASDVKLLICIVGATFHPLPQSRFVLIIDTIVSSSRRLP
jgi:tetrahydromethanopterin S-methyltransferase subunit D